MNFVSKTVGGGFPEYLLENVPAESNFGLKITQPAVYYGRSMPGYLFPHGFRSDVCRGPPRAGFDSGRTDDAFQRSGAIAKAGTPFRRRSVTSRPQSMAGSTRKAVPDKALDDTSGGALGDPSRLYQVEAI